MCRICFKNKVDKMSRYINNIFLWLVPVVMLLLSLLPMNYPVIFPLVLEIIVSLAAAVITYLLFTQKPKYYIIWAIAFIVIVLIYNPLIRLSVIMGIDIPLALITAIIFITNWWFVFRTRS